MFILGPLQEKWMQSLEQHPERQGRNTLGVQMSNGSYKACCLGEGGLTAGICRWDEEGLLVDIDSGSTHYLDSGYIKLGLRDKRGVAKDYILSESMASMNDDGYSWPEIAAIVRGNPEAYFTDPV